MSVEKYKDTNEKWGLLVNDLSKSEALKYKYTQVYERIIKSNDQKDYKILLGIAHRVFLKDRNIRPARGKETALISEYNDVDFSVNGEIIMDLVVPFVEAISDMIIEECHKHDNSLSHLIHKKDQIILVF